MTGRLILVPSAAGLTRFRQTFRERAAEWACAYAVLVLGIALFSASPEMFDRPYFALLRSLAPQYAWASACAVVGAARLVVLWLNGGFRPSPVLRQIGCGFGLMIWLALIIGSFSYPGGSIGWTYLSGLFLLDLFSLSFAASDGVRYRVGAGGHVG